MAEFEEFDGMLQTEVAIWGAALRRIGDYRLTFGSAKVVSSATAANPVVPTANAHGLVDGDLCVITGFSQMLEVNSRVFRVEGATTNTFQLADENGLSYAAETSGGFVRKIGTNKAALELFGAWPMIRDSVLRQHPWNSAMKYDRLARLQTARTITGATAANPVVVTTSAPHGFVQGDTVRIRGVVGMVELNDRYFTVGTVPTATTFQLSGIDGTLFTTYSSGGQVQKALSPLSPDARYDRRFDLPSDCLRLLELEDLDTFEVVGREVYTDSGITVPIRYIRRLRDTTLWDALLQDHVSARLAYEICESIGGVSAEKKKTLREDLQRIRDISRAVDAQEQSVNEPAQDEWELDRY